VFATSSTFRGDLGGLAGADAKCADSASSAGRAGSWTAWLSDASADALDRIADVGPWALLDGTVAFDDKAMLATHPHVPLDIDEKGQQTFACVWTGTLAGGRRSPMTCAGWTSTTDPGGGLIGTGASDGRWTADVANGPCGASTCASMFKLYCFEQ
jgi:hypothetical protein